MDETTLARQDTFNEIIRSRLQQALRIPPEGRLLAGLDHSDLSMKVVEDGIRHQHPEATESTIRQLLIERIALMRRMEEPR